METKIIKTNNDKQQIETLRKEVFHLREVGDYYLNELINNKKYALATLDNDKIIAGCYFHRFNNILMIDQLFVKEEYQNTGLKLGRVLIKKLLLSKKELESLLGGTLTHCYIESQNKKANALYKKIGFSESKHDNDILHKRL